MAPDRTPTSSGSDVSGAPAGPGTDLPEIGGVPQAPAVVALNQDARYRIRLRLPGRRTITLDRAELAAVTSFDHRTPAVSGEFLSPERSIDPPKVKTVTGTQTMTLAREGDSGRASHA